jgi:hypothetical protein
MGKLTEAREELERRAKLSKSSSSCQSWKKREKKTRLTPTSVISSSISVTQSVARARNSTTCHGPPRMSLRQIVIVSQQETASQSMAKSRSEKLLASPEGFRRRMSFVKA